MGVLSLLYFMLLGEVVFGGLGAGVYSIFMIALHTLVTPMIALSRARPARIH